ncbi:MAG: hypothetical protein BAA01_06315 [Bacillus thermozeamaize]|uniref:Acyl-coenzyme A thioesterase THEM4 n=1 Tax=Bacillus thermozeamaize TaxID=230954 RepID=A0A1Y3PEF8_9BACI|nr:MAG: hypothetical protein BAA01_06315 [Bacillus thermozeamaize]
MGFEGCFACDQENPKGLGMRFKRVGEGVRAEFCPEKWHVGWPGIQHGGLTCTIMDEALGYVVHHLGVVALTGEMHVSFLAPIRVGERVTVEAYPVRKRRRIIDVEAVVRGEDGQIKAKCQAKMLVLSDAQKEEMGLTGLKERPTGSQLAEKSAGAEGS